METRLTALNHIKSKLFTLDEFISRASEWRSQDNKLVFTNGVFDILHVGHVTYLAEASGYGNKLIIGLNADSSVKRLKGPARPINDQSSRAIILAALTFVDAVIIFEEDTPLNLITTLLPDVLIKGADYSIDAIVGAKEVLANGGSVNTITFVDGYSSTLVINKANLV